MIARYLTWVLIALYPLLLVAIAALWLAGTPVRSAAFLVPMSAFAGVGAVLVVRRPQNAVGWLCLAIALTGGSSFSASAYATYTLTAPGSPPGGAVAAWWAGWIGPSPYLIITNFLLLLFPNGHPPSPRWRPLLWASFACLVLFSLGAGLAPGQLVGAPEFENPFGVAFLSEPSAVLARGIIFFGQIALSFACLASLVVRYRHSRSSERQQLKWFTAAFAFLFLVLLSGNAVSLLNRFGVPVPHLSWQFPLAITMIPVAIGIAILRYRLYDIDLLINRTLVYGALTALLAATYFGAVALLQSALRPFTSGSELAVAGSTLVVVALFQPVRRRVQDAVDRRFSRSHYDAARTLDDFSARLRDEVDLDAVRADLLGAVRDTVRPAHASVWLRQS